MMLSPKLEAISKSVASRMSKKRFRHILGVVDAAIRLAEYCLPEKKEEIAAAAFLHDITKELPTERQLELLHTCGANFTDSDFMCEPIHHSLTAPMIIARDFPEMATDEIISAVRNHTVGSPDMSVFDEIIFVADYVEEGREYADCVRVRNKLFSALLSAEDADECVFQLHRATREILDYTITYIIKKQGFLHERTVMTRNAFLAREPQAL